MSPELQDYAEQIQRIELDARDLVEALSAEQACWRPGPGRWSVVECLDHLNQTFAAYLPALDDAIARSRVKGWYARGPSRYAWLGTMMVRSLEPPPKRAFRAPGGITPLADLAPTLVAEQFFEQQHQLDQRLRQADGLDLARARVVSPIISVFRLRLGQCFAFLLAHERRHLWQARRVIEQPGFPS